MYSGIDLHSNNSVVTVIDEADRIVAQKRLPNVLGQKRSPVAQFDFVSHMGLQIVREHLARACSNQADPAIMQFLCATETVGTLAQFLDHG
jgi:hypothetical protein